MPSPGVPKWVWAILALASLVNPAHAQLRSEPPLTQSENGLMLDTDGYQLWLPAPNWLDASDGQSGNLRERVDATFRTADGEALLEIYPKGEGEALWTTLYGVRLSTGSDFELKSYREAVISGFSVNCDPARLGFFQLGQDEGDDLAPLGYVCGAFNPRLRTYKGLGEVMVMSFRKQEDAVALIFQQWRGKSFDPADAASWPVATDLVEATAQRLRSEPRLQRAD